MLEYLDDLLDRIIAFDLRPLALPRVVATNSVGGGSGLPRHKGRLRVVSLTARMTVTT
jgi:hypothetical protein